MQPLLLILMFACLLALGNSAIESLDVNLIGQSAKTKDTAVAASDRTFHISKDYGQLGGYTGGIPYGTNYASIYGTGTGYQGTGGGYLNSGYRGHSLSWPNGITGGGNNGYGYYESGGYNPVYAGRGGSGGFGNYGGLGSGYNGYGGGYNGYGGGYNGYGGGYSGYGGGYGLDNLGSGVNDYGYGGRGGSDAYGYRGGYGGYGGLNYGSSYNARNYYDPYSYRGNSYGSYPSGYRGYS